MAEFDLKYGSDGNLLWGADGNLVNECEEVAVVYCPPCSAIPVDTSLYAVFSGLTLCAGAPGQAYTDRARLYAGLEVPFYNHQGSPWNRCTWTYRDPDTWFTLRIYTENGGITVIATTGGDANWCLFEGSTTPWDCSSSVDVDNYMTCEGQFGVCDGNTEGGSGTISFEEPPP